MSPGAPCRVILLGMVGSGKTTVGARLSQRTGWPYHDNDALLRAATGQTARELSGSGVEAVRSAEAAAARAALEMPVPGIVACAAGAVTDHALRDRLRHEGIVIWLSARAEVLAERAAGSAHRPWLDGDAVEWLSRTAEERRPLYREIADLEIDTESGAPDALAERIIERLAETSCRAHLEAG